MRSLFFAFGFFVARWVFHRKPLTVAAYPVRETRDGSADPVARFRRAGAL